MTVVAVMSTLMLEGGCVFTSNNAAAMVMAAQTVADDGIEVDDPAGAATISEMMQHPHAGKKESQ